MKAGPYQRASAVYEGSLSDPIDVDPGEHVLEASLEAKRKRLPVTAVAGKPVAA